MRKDPGFSQEVEYPCVEVKAVLQLSVTPLLVHALKYLFLAPVNIDGSFPVDDDWSSSQAGSML